MQSTGHGIDAQGAEHALGVVDLEAVDAEALADGVLDLLDVDAIDRAGAGALVAADAGGQVEAVEAAVARLDRHGQFGVLEALGERLAAVGLQEVPEGDVHALGDGLDGQPDVAEPGAHEWSRSKRTPDGGECHDTVDYREPIRGRKREDEG